MFIALFVIFAKICKKNS